jgi:hypothetical protein
MLINFCVLNFAKTLQPMNIPVFVIFSHLPKGFFSVSLGVQTHVITQKKGTTMFFKKPFADFRGLASVILETVFRGTIFHYGISKFSSKQ